MNILLISKNSPFESIGGIERYIDNLIDYFKTNTNKDVKLFLLLLSTKENHTETKKHVKIYFSNSLYLSKNTQIANKETSKKSQTFAEELTNIVKGERIDIICAENFHTDLPAAYSLSLNMVTMMLKIPLVLQIHSFASTQLQTELINQLNWDKISCVSKSVAGDCFQKGANINLLSTHYLGVNTDKFKVSNTNKKRLKTILKISDKSQIILTATRIIRGKRNILHEKGIINLVESFSKISPRYPNLYLVIAAGKPPEYLMDEFNIAYEMLQGYIKLHDIEKKTFIKMFKLNEMPHVYRGSDIFVLPSENETFGQVFLEAMSCGIPIIGTKVGGIPEIISDSYNGYLVPLSDSSILAQKITYLLGQPTTSKKFINAGLKTIVEKFSSTNQFDKFINILNEVSIKYEVSNSNTKNSI